MQGSTKTYGETEFHHLRRDLIPMILGLKGLRHLLAGISSTLNRDFNMRDWEQHKLAVDWTLYHLEHDREVWLMEHTKCNGTVAYDNEPFVCSMCKTELPAHLILATLIFLKRGLIRV